MAITLKMLEGIDIPDDVKQKVVTLSQQDEQNTVDSLVEERIKTRIGEVYGNLEKDFEEATGIKKPAGSGKTYEWIKSESKKLSSKAQKVDSLQDKVTELEEKIKAGVSDQDALKDLQTKLSDAQQQLEDVRGQYEKEKESWEAEKQSWEAENFEKDVLSSLKEGLAGVTFDDSIPDKVRSKFIDTEMKQILSDYKIEEVEVEGTKTFHFRDKDSNRLLGNPDDGQRPFTPETLAQYRLKDVIKENRSAGGGGSSPGGGGGGNGAFVLQAKTQLDANKQIEDYLMKHKSLSKTDPAFHAEKSKLWKDTEAAELPVK